MPNRAPAAVIERLERIRDHAEAMADLGDGKYGHSRNGFVTAAFGRDTRERVHPYVSSWIAEPLDEIIEYLQGGDRPYWWERSAY